MIINVKANGLRYDVKLTASRPGIVSIQEPAQKYVTVVAVRNGKSNYELWVALPENEGKTLEDYLDWLQGGPSSSKTFDELRAENPQITGNIDGNGNTIENIREALSDNEPATLGQAKALRDEAQTFASEEAAAITLENARNTNNVLQGDIDANENSIVKLRNGLNNQDACTVGQAAALLQEAKEYTDLVSTNTVRWVSFWDFTGGVYPNGVSGGIRRGDEFEANNPLPVIMPDGTEIEKGDLVRSRINSPGQTPTNWSVSQGNAQQSTEAYRGTMKVATGTSVGDKNTTNDNDAVTPKKLWENFVPAFVQTSITWTLKHIFNTAPRFASVNAGQYLKVDANKDLTSVNAIPADDVTDTLTRVMVSPAEKAKIGEIDNKADKEFSFVQDADNPLTNATTPQQIFKSTSAPNGAFDALANSLYHFDINFCIEGMNATNVAMSFGVSGSAVVTSILYTSHGFRGPSTGTAPTFVRGVSVSDLVVTAVSTGAFSRFRIKGTFTTSTGGTFQPTITFPSATTGAATKKGGSMIFKRLGSSSEFSSPGFS